MSVYEHDVTGCLDSAIGAAGLTSSEQNVLYGEAQPVLSTLQELIKAEKLPFIPNGNNAADIADQVELAYERLSDGARTIMFFGCGDAGVIGQAIGQYGGWGIPGVMIGTQKQRPVTRFYSSPDPVAVSGALSRSDLDRARFVFVSKTGDVSTVSQAVAALEAVRQRGLESAIPNLFLFVTAASSPGTSNGLDQLGLHYGIPRIALPGDIDETFSGLTAAGLLPAIARGLNIRKILEGASVSVAEFLAAQNSDEAPSARAAAIMIGLRRYRNCRQQIITPFDDRLTELARYCSQLRSCREDGSGTLRTALLCQGPQERARLVRAIKVECAAPSCFTLLHTSPREHGSKLPADLAGLAGLDGANDTHLGDVIADEQEALSQVCREHGQPVREIRLHQLDEQTLGAFLIDMMLEAIFTDELTRNGVNG